jgi:hypothetical protein
MAVATCAEVRLPTSFPFDSVAKFDIEEQIAASYGVMSAAEPNAVFAMLAP